MSQPPKKGPSILFFLSSFIISVRSGIIYVGCDFVYYIRNIIVKVVYLIIRNKSQFSIFLFDNSSSSIYPWTIVPKSLENGATACVQRSLDHAYMFPYSKSVN